LTVSHVGAILEMSPRGNNTDCGTHKEGFCGEYVKLGEWIQLETGIYEDILSLTKYNLKVIDKKEMGQTRSTRKSF
jgi:hypothetical protein